jgi:addiction module HigA family antidote
MEKRNIIRDVSHPGEILRELYINEIEGLNQKVLAASIGVSFRTINQICNKRRGISPEVAVKLAKFFNTTPNLWLNLQTAYDLQKALKSVDVSDIKTIAV